MSYLQNAIRGLALVRSLNVQTAGLILLSPEVAGSVVSHVEGAAWLQLSSGFSRAGIPIPCRGHPAGLVPRSFSRHQDPRAHTESTGQPGSPSKTFRNLTTFFFFFSRLLSTLKLLQNHGISQFSATLSLAVISVSLVQAQFQFKKYSNGCSNTCKNNCLSQLSAEISTISSQGLQWLKKACFKSVWGG